MYYLISDISINGGKDYDLAVPNILLSMDSVLPYLRTDCRHQRGWVYSVTLLNSDIQPTTVHRQWDKNINCDLTDYDYAGNSSILTVTPLHANSIVISITDEDIANCGGTLDDAIADQVSAILVVDFLYTVKHRDIESNIVLDIKRAVELLEGMLLVNKEYYDATETVQVTAVIDSLKYIDGNL